MLSPGEQPRGQPVKPREVVAVLLFCVAIMAVLIFQREVLSEYKLYFTQDRKAAALDFAALSEEWTERTVRERFAGYPIICVKYQGPLPVQRACAVDVASANGVPALYISFFFASGRLDQVSINVLWWYHHTAYQGLIDMFGPPTGSQLLPIGGVRLHGWKLASGAAVFLNRDRSLNPLQWSSIYWRSPLACKTGPCFRK